MTTRTLSKLLFVPQVKYSSTATFLHDNSLLDASHWSEEHKAYLDFGLHTEGVRLRRPPVPNPRPGMPQPDKVREVYKEPQLQYVNQFGYISKSLVSVSTPVLVAIQ